MSPASMLVLIKLLHTIVWTVVASAIGVLPWLIWQRRWRSVLALIGLVLVECAVLAANGMRCPLTDLAARHTANRGPNFDIYLPLWVAARNKMIFGTLFGVDLVLAGVVFFLGSWMDSPGAKAQIHHWPVTRD